MRTSDVEAGEQLEPQTPWSNVVNQLLKAVTLIIGGVTFASIVYLVCML